MNVYIEEIFGSFQGEGPWVGLPQYFLRFSGCNLKCTYCDTPARLSKRPHLKFEAIPGSGQFEIYDNPVKIPALIQLLGRLMKNFKARSLALTGGEPLLFVPALKQILPAIRTSGTHIYLETNGICPDELLQIKDQIDFVSMDYKLEKYLQGDPAEALHERFIEILKKDFAGRFYIKLVYDNENPEDIREIKRIDATLARLGISNDLTVLQPIVRERFPQSIAVDSTLPARLIPQTHKALTIL